MGLERAVAHAARGVNIVESQKKMVKTKSVMNRGDRASNPTPWRESPLLLPSETKLPDFSAKRRK